MNRGQVVYSKCGRDKGFLFVVLTAEAGYVLLADGKVHRLEKPKKKKTKHVQPTNILLDLNAAGPRGLQDADLRKWLLEMARSVNAADGEE